MHRLPNIRQATAWGVLILGLATGRVLAMTDEEFVEAFDPFVGVWQGEYQIYSQQDEMLNEFRVSRNYWWDESVLMARIDYDFGGVSQTYFHRIMLSGGIPFAFVNESMDSDEDPSALRGEVIKGTIVWTRVLPKEGLPVRISERIVENDGGRFIEFWGDQEARNSQGQSLLVRIDGFLSYLRDSRDFDVATDTPSATDPPVLEGELSDTPAEPRARQPAPAKEDPAENVGVPTMKRKPATEPKPVETESPDRLRPAPVPASTEMKPIAELEAALGELNIIGVNDDPDEPMIVVDYFLVYRLGDRVELDVESAAYFTAIKPDYLVFEDTRGFEYRVRRKDLEG